MMLRCEKCKIKNVYVEMRQCGYPLCNNCEKKRLEEIKKKNSKKVENQVHLPVKTPKQKKLTWLAYLLPDHF